MFDELTEEAARPVRQRAKGYGSATYAAVEDEPCSSGLCCSVILCCTCTTLCW